MQALPAKFVFHYADDNSCLWQVVGAISVIVVLVTILALGPVFEPLPRSVLGCIIIVGLFGILQQLSFLKSFYQQSKFDFVSKIRNFSVRIVRGNNTVLNAQFVYFTCCFLFSLHSKNKIAQTTLPRPIYFDECLLFLVCGSFILLRLLFLFLFSVCLLMLFF